MLDIVKKYKEQEKQIQQLRLVINDYIVDLAKANRKVEEYKTMYELEQKIVVADELRIMKAIDLIKDKTKVFPGEDGGGLGLFDYDIEKLLEILKGVKE